MISENTYKATDQKSDDEVLFVLRASLYVEMFRFSLFIQCTLQVKMF